MPVSDDAAAMPVPDTMGIPLRRVILWRVMLLVTGAALLVGIGFVIFGFAPLVERIAQSQFNVAASQVKSRLDATFDPAENLLNMSRGWINGEPPSLENPEAFNRQFMPVLKSMPQITSVVAGTNTGQGWLLLEQPGDQWRNRMTDVPKHGNRHLFFDHTADGKTKVQWQERDYDARKRPWYIAAMQGKNHGAVHWTAPYIFFTTGDPGITASTRMTLKDSRDFVLGFDLMLRDLSETTMQAKVGKLGLAAVVTQDNKVLALPAPRPGQSKSDWLKQVLRPLDVLGIPALSIGVAKWREGIKIQEAQVSNKAEEGGPAVVRFESGGETWLASIRPYRLGEQTLQMVVMAPAADFAPSWTQLGIVLVAGVLLVLGLSVVIVRAAALRVAQPLEHLAEASKRIGQLDFSASSAIQSPITELQQLASTQDQMRLLLERNQQDLAQQSALLNAQILAQRETEARLRESESYNKVLFSDSRIPLVVLDPSTGNFVDCNQAAVEIYRTHDRVGLLGKTIDGVSAPHQYNGQASAAAMQLHIQKALAEGMHVFEWRNRHTDGSEWDAEIHLMRFRHAGRSLLQFSLQDITAKKAAAEEIAQLAFYDTLTLLPNRRLLADRLNQLLAVSARTGSMGALLFIDLDNFKSLNDTFGHDQGDLLLQQVARRLMGCVREGDTVGRFGGDEFLVILADVSEDPLQVAQRAELVGRKILESLNRPYDLNGHEHYSSPSIGITLFAKPGDSLEELLKRADIAMYQAKAAGRNALRFYDPNIQAQLTARTELETYLRQAVTRGELVLYYQRQVDSRLQTIGAEALVRWNHPAKGLLSPNEFIPLAEETGMIIPIGHWVLRAACKRLVEWSYESDLSASMLAVNVSSRQFRHPDFVEQVLGAIRETGANPRKLKLELTESVLLEDVENTISKMLILREAGLSFALDDFGTGFSSLSYLKRLPLDELKIDQSFVRDVLTDPNDAAIARAVITLAHSLGLNVIAEGVETEAQREFLNREGCRAFQGYLFGKPAP